MPICKRTGLIEYNLYRLFLPNACYLCSSTFVGKNLTGSKWWARGREGAGLPKNFQWFLGHLFFNVTIWLFFSAKIPGEFANIIQANVNKSVCDGP